MTQRRNSLVKAEIRATGALATIFALRMFGLFMLLPVLALLGSEMEGATESLIGTAVGIYGLMQALLQVPFGTLSDRLGRRRMIIAGLVLFILGGLVAASADTIYGVIAGRAMQGAGAIASVIMALVSDVVSEKHRTRAMAAIGMSVGGSFVLAMIIGPLVASWVGLTGLFLFTSVLGCVAIVVAAVLVPSPRVRVKRELWSRKVRLDIVLRNRDLMGLNFGILVLHLVMTSSFVVLPLLLKERLGFTLEQHSLLYLVVMIVGFLAMVPLIIAAERRGFRRIKLFAVLLLAGSEIALASAGAQMWHFVVALLAFFTAFNLLEALLPSLVGRAAPVGTRGTSMGIYSSSQFFGVFLGGELGGQALRLGDGSLAFIVSAAMLIIWWVMVWFGRELPRLESRVMSLAGHEADESEWVERLLAVDGVLEAVVVQEEGIAMIKIDPATLDEVALSKYVPADATAG